MGKLNLGYTGSVGAVFEFFEEISEIPRGSGNTDAIADYLVSFAKTRRLIYERDAFNNVIIKKGATSGYENRPTVIIQGHTDIVADKISTSKKDLTKEGLDIYLDGDFIKARETTLGGDDGIAVAYALALLDSRDIPHPAIEALFTSDEEIGLIGATGLNTDSLEGKILINVDSDDEGVFTVGCAGGLRMDLHFDLKRENASENGYRVSVSGLIGGHSGVEIDKGRTNALKCLGEILGALSQVKLVSFSGGNADNAIPRDSTAVFTTASDEEAIQKIIENTKKSLIRTEPNVKISLSRECGLAPFSEKDSKRVLSALSMLPSGVVRMDELIEGMVETSMNVGIIETLDGGISISASLRSSKGKEKDTLKARVHAIGREYGAETSERGEYPEWEYRENSRLSAVMQEVYRDMYQKEPAVITIHAGLECGIFSKKIKELDCVSIGPDGFDIHTPDERLSVSSSVRVFEFLLEVLKRI